MFHALRPLLLCASAALLAVAGASPLWAAEATQKLIAENDKLRVIDVIEKPGETGPMASRLGTVFHVIAGGTFERTYADGSTEITPRKTGDTILVTEKRPYSVKNIGTTTIHLIQVVPK